MIIGSYSQMARQPRTPPPPVELLYLAGADDRADTLSVAFTQEVMVLEDVNNEANIITLRIITVKDIL